MNTCMLIFRTKYSLNAISHDSAIALVKRALEKGVNVKEVNCVAIIFVCKQKRINFSPSPRLQIVRGLKLRLLCLRFTSSNAITLSYLFPL